ncbi:MAG: hypothetical protein V1912_11315 [bacterium]
MSRDGFRVMDIDIGWAYHRKMRRLQRLYPDQWPMYAVAYWALLADAWRASSREVTFEESWCPAIPSTIEEAQVALERCGFIDSEGRIPPASWEDWFMPAADRVEAKRARGKHAADVRWHSVRNADAMPEQSNGYTPNQAVPSRTKPIEKSSTPRATSTLARERSPLQEPRLTKEQLDAWTTFGSEWAAFKEAWLARGFLFPPAGSPDGDDTSQRGLLWQVLDDCPTKLPQWVKEAPGKTVRDVVAYILGKYHELREEVGPDEDDDPRATAHLDRTALTRIGELLQPGGAP